MISLCLSGRLIILYEKCCGIKDKSESVGCHRRIVHSGTAGQDAYTAPWHCPRLLPTQKASFPFLCRISEIYHLRTTAALGIRRTPHPVIRTSCPSDAIPHPNKQQWGDNPQPGKMVQCCHRQSVVHPPPQIVRTRTRRHIPPLCAAHPRGGPGQPPVG